MIDARSIAMDFSSGVNADAFALHPGPLVRSEEMMAPRSLIKLIALFSIPITAPDVRASDAEVKSRHVLKGRIIRSLAIDPSDANHVLVGQKGASPGSALVFRTHDGGETWQTFNGNRPLDPNATDVQAVVALSSEVLLAGTWKHGLYR